MAVDTDSIETIDLNPFLKNQRFDFGSLIKDVKLVPLETTDKSLLDDINKVVVTDTHIYILDYYMGGGLVIFDNKGKFIKRIPNGKGPGELVRLYDIDFDKENNQLVAYQHSAMMFYSPSGEYIGQKRLVFAFYNFAVTPQGYVFKTLDRQGNEHLGKNFQDFTFLTTDKDFKLKSAGLPYPPNIVNYGITNYLQKSKLEIYATHKYFDTVYQYTSTSDKLQAKYKLNYDKKRLPQHYATSNLSKFDKITKENDYYFFMGKFLDSETHNVFFLENDHTGQAVIYRNKASKNLVGGTIANYFIRETPPIAFPNWTSGDYFISLYYSNGKEPFITESSIISDADKIKMKGVTEDSNPVLVFFKLKDF